QSRPARGEEEEERHAGEESPDMRPVGNPPRLLEDEEAPLRAEPLEEEPDPDEDEGRDPRGREEDEDRDQGGDPRRRTEEDVGPDVARDRARGPDRRDLAARGVEVEEDVEGRGGDSAGEVEDEEPRPPESVLDVVAEDPEEPHVPDQVEPPPMEE